MIAIIDYGIGNLGAIHNMFKKIGVQLLFSSDKTAITNVTKLVLFGIGAFDTCLRNLKGMEFSKRVLEEKTPLIDICFGMNTVKG